MKNMLTAPLTRKFSEAETNWASKFDERRAAETVVWKAKTTEISQAAKDAASRAARAEQRWADKIYLQLSSDTDVRLSSEVDPRWSAPKNIPKIRWGSIVEDLESNTNKECYGWTEQTDSQFPGHCQRHMRNISGIQDKVNNGMYVYLSP